MAQKVNKKFIAALAGGFILTGTATAIAYQLIQKTAAEHLEESKALASEQDWEGAMRELGHAVHEAPDNIEAKQAMLLAVQTFPTDQISQAQDWMGRETKLYYDIAVSQGSNEEAWDNYFQHLLQRTNHSPSFFNRIHQDANKRLRNAPGNLAAQRYRGIAVALAPTLFPNPSTREQVSKDLEAAIKVNPNDKLAMYAKARWELVTAGETLQTGLSQESVKANIDLASELAGKITSGHSTNAPTIQHLTWALQIYTQVRNFDPDRFLPLVKQTTLALHETTQLQIQSLDDPHLLTQANRLLRAWIAFATASDDESLSPTTVSTNLLQAYLTNHPNDPIALTTLASLQSTSQPDNAIETYNKIINIAANPAPAATYVIANTQADNAKYNQALIFYNQVAQNPDKTTQAKRAIKEASSSLKVSGGSLAQNRILHLDALLAALNNDIKAATQKFSFAIEQSATEDPNFRSTLLNDAIKVGFASSAQSGLLRNWLELAVKTNPADHIKRFQLGQLYLQAARQKLPGSDYKGLAANQASILTRSLPDSPAGPWIQAQLLALETPPDFDLALKTIEPYDEALKTKLPRYYYLVPRWMAANGQRDQAIEMMRERYESNPLDIDNTVRYASTKESEEEKKQILDRLSQTDLPQKVQDQLEVWIAGSKEEQAALLESQTTINTPQVDPEVATLHVARSQNDTERVIDIADQMIRDAKSVENAWYFKLQAIAQQGGTAQAIASQKEKALTLVAAAARDSGVSELFWRARIALFTNDKDRAKVLIQRALEANPSNSMGYSDLAEAYLLDNDLSNALRSYQKSLNLSGARQGRRALLGMFNVNYKQGNHKEALEALQTLARNNLLYTTGEWLNYAAVEEQYGSKEQASNIRTRLAENTPSNYPLRRQLALGFATDGNETRAYEAMNGIVADQGLNIPNVAILATLDRRFKSVEAGRQRIVDFINTSHRQSDHAPWQMLGEYLFESGATQQAIDAYQKAIELEPVDTMPASHALAEHFVQNNAFDLAKPLLEKLSQADPDNESVLVNYLATLTSLGMYEQALPIAQRLPQNMGAFASTKASQAISRNEPLLAIDTINKRLAESQPPTPNGVAMLKRLRAEARSKAIEMGLYDVQKLQNALQANVQDLRDVHQTLPTRSTFTYELTQALRRTGNTKEAISLLLPLTQSSNNPLFSMALVEAYLEDGTPSLALQHAQAMQSLQPDAPQWPRLIANAYANLRQPGASADAWVQTANLSQALADVINAAQSLVRSKRYGDVLKLVNTHPGMFQQHLGLSTLQAIALQQTGSPDAAKQLFAKALLKATSPEDLASIAVQTGSQQGLGPNDAITLLTNQTIHPETWRALAIARIHMVYGNHAEAEKALAPVWQAETKDSKLALALSQTMGIVQQQLNHADLARVAYERALEIDPDRIEVLNNLAYLLATDLNSPEAALPLAQKASTLSGSQIPAIDDTLGMVLVQLGQFEDARRILEPLTRLAQPMALANYHLGLALAGLEDPRATVALNRAIRLANENGESDVAAQAKAKLASLLSPSGAP